MAEEKAKETEEVSTGRRQLIAADLFCGAGGFSTGLLKAADSCDLTVKLLAVNHWTRAIATHSLNHPNVRHLCQSVESCNPLKLFPDGRLDVLLASPECTEHSYAKGGKPKNDQRRVTAWSILDWAQKLKPKVIIIENVREFGDWGPLDEDDNPIPELRGTIFDQFVATLKALGYTVDMQLLTAADYGDPTTRRRLIIVARRGQCQITWPLRTHAPHSVLESCDGGSILPWCPASEIIDWSITGQSVFNRPRPLARNTMRRVFVGLEKFSGMPFIVPQFSGQAPRSVELPLNTLTTTSRGIGLACPYIVKYYGTSNAASILDPLGTVTGKDRFALASPYLVVLRNHMDAKSIDEPVPTIAAGGTHISVAQPYIVSYHGGHGDALDGDRRVHSVQSPLPTIDTSNRFAVAKPYIVINKGQSNARSIDEPCPTITAEAFHLYLAEPIIRGMAAADFGVYPKVICDGVEIGYLDILYRMLEPKELAWAMSFPRSYAITGTKEQQVCQIGNAIPVELACAVIREQIRGLLN
jgi:DNA (cytosine-5)-methyltransferase 1